MLEVVVYKLKIILIYINTVVVQPVFLVSKLYQLSYIYFLQVNGSSRFSHRRTQVAAMAPPYAQRRTKMYSCPYCNRTLKCIRNLRGHMAAQHNQTKEFPCTCCTKQFAYKTSLKQHMITAHDKNSYC